MSKIRHVIRWAHLVREELQPSLADQAPFRIGGAELRRLRALVGIGPRDADCPDACTLIRRENEISGGDFAHELVEGIARFLLVSLRRPELAAARLLSEGLILVHPPKPHGRAQAENYTRTRPYPSLVLSLLAKQVLLNLSAPRHREGVDEEDAARDL